MITVSKRQKDIAKYLSKQTDFITIRDIAAHFSISERTCRNDLSAIEAFLKESGILLRRKTGKGVLLECTDAERQFLNDCLLIPATRSYDIDERENISIALLLINETTTFQELADKCLVSRQTLINQFSRLEQRLEKNAISIKKNPGKGLSLKGEEKSIRFQFLEILETDVCRQKICQMFCEHPQINAHLKTAAKIVNEIQDLKKLDFIDFGRIQLILAYTLSRIEQGHTLKKDWVYNNDSQLKEVIAEYFPSDSEQYFICSLIQAERANRFRPDVTIEDEAQMISHDLISSLDRIHPIEKDSFKDIIDGLTVHLRAAIYRSRNHISIKNELLDQIKMSASLMFEFTRHELCRTEKEYGITFDENEISYIAMYLTSIYETSINAKMSVDILIICSYGLAASAVLKLRLEQAFPGYNIWGPCSVRDAAKYLDSAKIDLIISANEYSNARIPVIVVNPLLTQKDLDKIRQKIYLDVYSAMCSTFFKAYTLPETRHSVGTYITPDAIQILNECKSWEDAIRIASAPLIKINAIEHRYVEEMINAVNNYGTYMVLTPEVAYVHAGVNDGIHRNCSAMLVIRDSVIFGNFDKKRIYAIVILGIKDRKEDSELINLAYILEKEDNLNQLKSKDITVQDILGLHD